MPPTPTFAVLAFLFAAVIGITALAFCAARKEIKRIDKERENANDS